MSASITHEAGREWLGAVRHASSSSFTRLNFSSAVQPVGRGTHRFESAFALSAILVAQHPKFSGTIAAQSVRTKQPKPLVIDGFYRFFVRYGRPDQPINILNSLDLCLDNAHSLPIRASPDVTSRGIDIYNTVILV
jgi:hypothetical protein